jgi:radical SAM superfamily enzyme YgiQ (UPF0313 family)
MFSYMNLPRLGLPMIGAALKQAGHDVVIYCPSLRPVDWDDVLAADLVGISSITATAPVAYEAADRLRRRGVPTVIGGSHATFMADEALEHADYVARGEGGDALMLELIDALEGRRDLDTIAGLSFMRDGSAGHNPLRSPCADLDTLPVPDMSLIAGCERLRAIPIMTSWGCPFACNFCSVTPVFGRKYRHRSPEHVVAEIKEKQPRRIFFYDDNFAADKKRLKALLQMMIDEGCAIRWTSQVRADVAKDPELLDLMRRSGCERLAIGFESINQATLDRYEKSQTVEDIARAVDRFHEYGIALHGMFVLGADTDSVETVRDTARFARKHEIESLMLNILTPLPGTRLYAELDEAGRIFDRSWDHYDIQHVVFKPAQMTACQLQREMLRAWSHFYSPGQWLKYVASLRLVPMLDHTWGWWLLHRWSRESGNRAHLEALEAMSRSMAPVTAVDGGD